MSTVAIYIRVSTLDQSTELQKRELLEYCGRRGWVPIVYEDAGHSGTTAIRPALRRLLADVRVHKVNTVVCWKLDRLFRSLKDLVVTLQEWQEHHVTLISIKDNIDLGTASGRLMMQMLGAFAEFEAALIQERVRAGLANARAKGKRLGRPPALTPLIVNRLKGLQAAGMSLRQIVKQEGLTMGPVARALKKRS